MDFTRFDDLILRCRLTWLDEYMSPRAADNGLSNDTEIILVLESENKAHYSAHFVFPTHMQRYLKKTTLAGARTIEISLSLPFADEAVFIASYELMLPETIKLAQKAALGKLYLTTKPLTIAMASSYSVDAAVQITHIGHGFYMSDLEVTISKELAARLLDLYNKYVRCSAQGVRCISGCVTRQKQPF
jgi:hypothetical protein